MRISIEQYEEAHKYMRGHWCHDSERWDDFTAFEVAGDTELLAHRLVEAGAIDSEYCYDEAKPIERICEALAKRFRKLSRKAQHKRIDEALENCFIASCDECNTVSFVYDGNETLYPELQDQCFECRSEKIKTYYWKDRK